MLNDAARTKLIEVVERHGHDFTDNPWRVQEVLGHELAAFKLERSVLIAASRESVPVHLRVAGDGSITSLKARLASKLVAEHGLNEPAARWAVDAWAEALGVASGSDAVEPKREIEPPLKKEEKPVVVARKQTGLTRAISLVVTIAIALLSATVPIVGLSIAAICLIVIGITKLTARIRNRSRMPAA